MARSLTTRRQGGAVSGWRADPFSALREQMADLFSRAWSEDDNGWLSGMLAPSADISETPNAVEVRLDMPGVKSEDIDIQVNDNLLTVSAERKEEQEEKGRTFHRVERRIGSFSRTLSLPCRVAADEAAADYHDGVLKITLPKTEDSKSQKIKVKG